MIAERFEELAIRTWASKQQWDADSAQLAGSMLRRWKLRPVATLEGGFAAVLLDVVQNDGGSAVLKVGFPHEEAISEAVALAAWAPFAPRVLRQDDWTWAMLLERVRPAVHLDRAALATDEALVQGARLLANLATVDADLSVFPTLSVQFPALAEAARTTLDDRAGVDLGCERSAIELALADGEALAAEPVDAVLLHGDFNPGNILSRGETWQVIDPKPLVGDPAFDPWPLISQLGDPFTSTSRLRHSLVIVSDVLGLDPVRVARWSQARSALSLCWHLDDGNRHEARAEAARMKAWHALI